jgi:NAD(P)-dependent dehydrogenase (short-subunit alcohol dehydrogenase family)
MSFNETTEAETIAQACYHQCDGKFVVSTGCSVGGIGFETARTLSKYGAEVLLCCRTQESCDAAVRAIRKSQHKDSLINVRGCVLDLSSFASIIRCAEFIISLHKPIHILINNASSNEMSHICSSDGFQLLWQVNYLGPFFLTMLLLPLLVEGGTTQSPARIIMLSSIMHYVYCEEKGIDFDTLKESTEQHRFKIDAVHNKGDNKNKKIVKKNTFRWFAESKLANVLFAKELSKRMSTPTWRESTARVSTMTPRLSAMILSARATKSMDDIDQAGRVIAVSVHPGIIPSNTMFRSIKLASKVKLGIELFARGTGKYIRQEKHKTVAQGAATTVFCALHPAILAGYHYADCNISSMVHNQARDEEAWSRLWEISEEQIDQRLDELDKVKNALKA